MIKESDCAELCGGRVPGHIAVAKVIRPAVIAEFNRIDTHTMPLDGLRNYNLLEILLRHCPNAVFYCAEMYNLDFNLVLKSADALDALIAKSWDPSRGYAARTSQEMPQNGLLEKEWET